MLILSGAVRIPDAGEKIKIWDHNYTRRKQMEYIPAKTIVTKTKAPGQWFGIDYNMNIYKGCCHGCIYCDSRSDCYGVDDFDRVRAKENALRIIRTICAGRRGAGLLEPEP